MKLLDHLDVYHNNQKKQIEFYQGDLSALPKEHAADIVVVSAYPDAYYPVEGTLLQALYDKGVYVERLSQNKAIDMRKTHSCWISEPLANQDQVNFKRILCFEPEERNQAPELVGDIFRSIIAFINQDPSIKTIAMPMVATGAQNLQVETILPSLVDAAVHWMSIGMSIKKLKVVCYDEKQIFIVSELLPEIKRKYQSFAVAPVEEQERQEYQYDIFISYSTQNSSEAQFILENLQKSNPSIRIFFDKNELNVGASWQQQIYDALDSSRKFIAIYSPQYLKSKVCMEEFNIAVYRDRESSYQIIFPIYLYTAELPTYMKTRQYFDCRENNQRLVAEACHDIQYHKQITSTTRKDSSVPSKPSTILQEIQTMRSNLQQSINQLNNLEAMVKTMFDKGKE